EGKAEFDIDVWSMKFRDGLQPLLTFVYGDAYESALDEVGRKGVKQEVPPESIEWLELHSLEMATSINLTTREMLRRTLIEGFAQGESIPKITRRIKGFFEETYKNRAKTIARTEVIAANSEGALKGYEVEGVQKAEFYTALDERVCEECMALHGNVYPISEAHGLIPVHPSCRCTYVPIV
ncbi:unnamed protein product, partial [marine sediment metagenome]